MVDMESHIKELCARIVPELDNCTYQDKNDAFTYLDLKVTATAESANIKGVIDSNLRMVRQSSGLTSSDAYSYLIPFEIIVGRG